MLTYIRGAFGRPRTLHRLLGVEKRLSKITYVRSEDAAEFGELVDAMTGWAESLDETVELASWLLRVTITRTDDDARDRVGRVLEAVVGSIPRFDPRPSPDSLVQLVLDHDARIVDAVPHADYPLVLASRAYTRLYNQERRRLESLPEPPSTTIASLSLSHRRHLQKLDDGMRRYGKRMTDEESHQLLLVEYRNAHDFGEATERWENARRAGGLLAVENLTNVSSTA